MSAPARPAGDATLRWLGWARGEVSLGPAECDAIVALGRSYPAEAAQVGDPAYAHRRQSSVRRVTPRPESEALHRRLDALGRAINEARFGLDLRDVLAPDYHEYHAGFGRFDWHDDYAYVSLDRVRKLTLIVQLSRPDEYEGGRVEVFAGEPVELPRDRGAVLAFPSFVPHRVTPVTSGVRCSLVVWLAGPVFR